jgi:crotonobetainyl-CoA:carnitine CoA-transferase CaiB-like acyl-CoA transferase
VKVIPDGPVPPEGATGPLSELRVIELASEWTCYAGKLLADLGADVVLVEPPEGAQTRRYGPFLEDRVDHEGSLWWWHYQTSKLGITLDLDDAQDQSRLRTLFAEADVVLEA